MNFREPNPTHGNNDWPTDDVDLLRRLSSEGLTANEIASRFPGRSRNAVIGKLNRMGLGIKRGVFNSNAGNESFWSDGKKLRELLGCVQSPLAYSNSQIAAHFGIGPNVLRRGLDKLKALGDRIKPLKTNINLDGSAPPKRVRKRGPITEQTTADAPPLVPKPEPIPTTAMLLWELTKADCRWPVAGEGAETKFCGAIALPDRPYCGKHCRMAYAGYSAPRLPAAVL